MPILGDAIRLEFILQSSKYGLHLDCDETGEEIGINAGNWVDSAEDRNYWRALVNAALNLGVS